MKRLEPSTLCVARTRPTRFEFTLSETHRDFREGLEPARAFGQVTLKPAQRSTLVLRRSALGIEVHELESVLERELGHLACDVLGHPECPPLDRAAEPDVRMRFRCHEHMFVTGTPRAGSRRALKAEGGSRASFFPSSRPRGLASSCSRERCRRRRYRQ